MVIIDGVEYGGVIEEQYGEADWIMGGVVDRSNVSDPAHTFADNKIQYNQNEYVRNTCTMYASMGAYSDLRGEEISLSKRKELVDLALERGLDPSYGRYPSLLL